MNQRRKKTAKLLKKHLKKRLPGEGEQIDKMKLRQLKTVSGLTSLNPACLIGLKDTRDDYELSS